MKGLAYIDSSLAIEYVNAEGVEHDDLLSPANRSAEDTYLLDLLKADRDFSLAAGIRKKLHVGSSRLQFVVSPLVWIEVNEWIAEERLKERASRVTQFTRLQREGKKRIGTFLREIRYASDPDNHLRPFNSVAEKLFKDTTISSRSLATGALKYITHVDLTGFSLSHTTIQTAVNLAYMQVGAADIMHLLVAAHIGCTHFATIDSDFDRVREAVEADLGLVVLFRDEILKAM
jgi:hypothetical protein